MTETPQHDRPHEPPQILSDGPPTTDIDDPPRRPSAVPGVAWGVVATPFSLTVPVLQHLIRGDESWEKVTFTDLGALRQHLADHFAPFFRFPTRSKGSDRPGLFESKFRSAVISALAAGGDATQLQLAWNMLQSCKSAPFTPDETVPAPLPIPQDGNLAKRKPAVDDSAWSDFFTILSKQKIGPWERQLKEFLVTTQSVQRTMFVPGVRLGYHLRDEGPELLRCITAAQTAGRILDAVAMANKVQHYVNLVIDGTNKAQHNVRVWVEEGEGEVEKGTTVDERVLCLELITLSRQLELHGATRKRATLVKNDFAEYVKERRAAAAALTQQ